MSKLKYTEKFKIQLVQLYNAGATQSEIRKQYGVAPSTLHGWIKVYNKSDIISKHPELSPAEMELIEIRRKLKRLEMENDILKQAALILGKK
ncbi:MAG: transposase [Mycoplasmatales bacterium]